MALEQYSFGSGNLWLVPLINGVATPVRAGTLQDASVDISWSDKELQGQYDAPSAIARGALKISGKIKAAKFRIADVVSVVTGGATAVGKTNIVTDEGLPNGKTIPAAISINTSAAATSGATSLGFASTTGVANGLPVSGTNIAAGTTVSAFTATTVTLSQGTTGAISSGAAIGFGGNAITVTNAAGFVDDLGVVNVNTGAQMTKVASAPAVGQYMVSNGVYTFSAADQAAAVPVLISYSYAQNASGVGFTYLHQLMGPRPTFKMVLMKPTYTNNPAYTSQDFSMTIWSAGFNKFSLDNKNEDWTVPESDFSASADYLGRVFTFGGDQ